MQFVVIGLDGTDSEAPERRQKVRQDHIKKGGELLKSGNLWYGAALLHDDGSMKGSVYILDYDNQEEFDQYMKTEPYVTGGVWRGVTVHKSNTREPWQFNRDQDWFEKRYKEQGL